MFKGIRHDRQLPTTGHRRHALARAARKTASSAAGRRSQAAPPDAARVRSSNVTARGSTQTYLFRTALPEREPP
jgi:hypothetical protein